MKKQSLKEQISQSIISYSNLFHITLSEEQEKALIKIFTFIKSKDHSFSLTGSAGTGKSMLLKYIIQYLIDNSIPYTIVAPTNKAALIVKQFTHNTNVTTLHSLLGLSPQLDIMSIDYSNLKFNQNLFNSSLPENGVLVIDEGSMINDELYTLLLKAQQDYNFKIYVQGDKAQLRPVNENSISKI